MKIIAHRGFSKFYPENTLLAFQKAIDFGANMIETDVRITKDEILVLFHDDSLNRIASLNSCVEELIYEDLKKIDAGSWFDKNFSNLSIPALKDLIKISENKITLILEIKYNKNTYLKLCKKIVEEISQYKHFCHISSFDDEILNTIYHLDSTIILHKLIETKTILEKSDFRKKYSFCSFFDIDINLKNHKEVQNLIATKNVIFWTVDNINILNEINLGLFGAMFNDLNLSKDYNL